MNCLLLYLNQVHSLFVMITVSKDEEKRSCLGGMVEYHYLRQEKTVRSKKCLQTDFHPLKKCNVKSKQKIMMFLGIDWLSGLLTLNMRLVLGILLTG